MKSLVFITDECRRPIKNGWSSHCTMVNDQSMTDQLKLTYLVGQSDLCGRPNSPLFSRPKILDMSNILLKNPDGQFFMGHFGRLWDLFCLAAAKEEFVDLFLSIFRIFVLSFVGTLYWTFFIKKDTSPADQI